MRSELEIFLSFVLLVDSDNFRWFCDFWCWTDDIADELEISINFPENISEIRALIGVFESARFKADTDFSLLLHIVIGSAGVHRISRWSHEAVIALYFLS